MKHILIIDDRPTEESNFIALKSNNNIKFHETSGINNGFDIAARYIPDMIICNFRNESDGLKLLEKISASEQTQTIPIIFTSSSNDDKHRRTIMNLGADDYFIRPLDSNELLIAIECLINKRAKLKEKMMDICRESLEAENKIPNKHDHILVTVGRRLQLIKYNDIVCITALKEYSKLRTFDGKNIVVRKSLKSWIAQLPPKLFLRIHRASIINVDGIEKIQKSRERNYVVHLRSLNEPLELSQRYSNIMRKTFPS
jgi:two-component system LytT family response regulator